MPASFCWANKPDLHAFAIRNIAYNGRCPHEHERNGVGLATYIAHYKSPNGENPVSGVFEFSSSHRAGSKQNMHDARMCQLDFREPVDAKPKKRITRGFK